MLKFVKYWLPAIIYAAGIFILSSFPHPPQHLIFPNADKVIHLVGYAIFCFLLTRAIGNKTNKIESVYLAVIIASIYGLSDEIHQAFVPGRKCSLIDWISDLSGALFFLLIKYIENTKRK